jgi:hypothetical protein
MGFVLFSHPVFLVCEKAVGVHTKMFALRVLVRIPVVAVMWFFALAVPFFGPINSVMGAFLVTVSVYIIPLAAFLITYRTKSARQVTLIINLSKGKSYSWMTRLGGPHCIQLITSVTLASVFIGECRESCL